MNCVSLSWIISGILLNYYMYWITKISLDNFWSSLYFATLIHARWFTETILISRKNKRWADFYSWRGKMILTYWIDGIKNMFSFLDFCTCVLSALVLETVISHFIQLWRCTLCALAFFNSDKIWLFLMNWGIWNCTSVMNFKKEEKLLTFMS